MPLPTHRLVDLIAQPVYSTERNGEGNLLRRRVPLALRALLSATEHRSSKKLQYQMSRTAADDAATHITTRPVLYIHFVASTENPSKLLVAVLTDSGNISVRPIKRSVRVSSISYKSS